MPPERFAWARRASVGTNPLAGVATCTGGGATSEENVMVAEQAMRIKLLEVQLNLERSKSTSGVSATYGVECLHLVHQRQVRVGPGPLVKKCCGSSDSRV